MLKQRLPRHSSQVHGRADCCSNCWADLCTIRRADTVSDRDTQCAPQLTALGLADSIAHRRAQLSTDVVAERAAIVIAQLAAKFLA